MTNARRLSSLPRVVADGIGLATATRREGAVSDRAPLYWFLVVRTAVVRTAQGAVMMGMLFSALVAYLVHSSGPVVESSPPYKIVVAPSNRMSEVKRNELAKLFLRKMTRWQDGQEVLPVDQWARSPVRVAFTRDILRAEGLSQLSAVESYWIQQLYSGRGTPPPVKSSDAEVLDFVARNPGAVGYVATDADTTGVRVVPVAQ
jgi:hypothetical protein